MQFEFEPGERLGWAGHVPVSLSRTGSSGTLRILMLPEEWEDWERGVVDRPASLIDGRERRTGSKG